MSSPSRRGTDQRAAAGTPALQVVRHVRRPKRKPDLRELSELLGRGEYDEAIIRLQLLLEQHREDVQTAELLASAYVLAYQPHRALELVCGIVAAHPDDVALNRLLYRA